MYVTYLVRDCYVKELTAHGGECMLTLQRVCDFPIAVLLYRSANGGT